MDDITAVEIAGPDCQGLFARAERSFLICRARCREVAGADGEERETQQD